MKSSQKTTKVDRIVARIDETRAAEHFRSPDRPAAEFVGRYRQDPEVRKAKVRLRTAAYRSRLDQRRAATTNQIGMALVIALVTSSSASMTRSDWNLVGRALADLQARGFDLNEVKEALRRLRKRVIDKPEGGEKI